MAQSHAPLASHGLEDFAGLVAPTRDRESILPPVEAQESALPSSRPYTPRTAADRVVPYPVRLTVSQIERLDALKASKGIVPAELIRHAVDVELDRVRD